MKAKTKTLFIPGPVSVDEQDMQQMLKPMVYHRSKEFACLMRNIQRLMQELLCTDTDRSVLVLTSSATGAMEAALRSCVQDKVLCIANGEFGRRWYEIAQANGKSARVLDFGDGKPIDYAAVADSLREPVEAVTFVINETSTGIENSLDSLHKVVYAMAKPPLILADAVTAAFGYQINAANADILLFGTQKSLALPPGIAIVVASQVALQAAKQVKAKGYYFDLTTIAQKASEGFTPTTPNIPLLYALHHRLLTIRKKGVDALFMEHLHKAELVRAWATHAGFGLFIKENFSKTVTVIENKPGIDIPLFMSLLDKKGYVIANGYGQLKDKTFRIGHMGGITIDDTKQLLKAADDVLAEIKAETWTAKHLNCHAQVLSDHA